MKNKEKGAEAPITLSLQSVEAKELPGVRRVGMSFALGDDGTRLAHAVTIRETNDVDVDCVAHVGG